MRGKGLLVQGSSRCVAYSDAKRPQLESVDDAITHIPSHLPPILCATAAREPSLHDGQLASAPAATPRGTAYANSIASTARANARGKVRDGRSTSPANVDAESKPESESSREGGSGEW